MRHILAALAFISVAGPATADCKARLAEMAPRVSELQDERERKLVEYDIKRAGRELREGDEDECTEALDHAASILDAKK